MITAARGTENTARSTLDTVVVALRCKAVESGDSTALEVLDLPAEKSRALSELCEEQERSKLQVWVRHLADVDQLSRNAGTLTEVCDCQIR